MHLETEFDNLIAQCKQVLLSKNQEYSKEENQFKNFESSAEEAGITVPQTWLVFFKKHFDSIASWCRTQKTHSDEPIGGRIIDAINYLAMLYIWIYQPTKEELLNKIPNVYEITKKCPKCGAPNIFYSNQTDQMCMNGCGTNLTGVAAIFTKEILK